jgi:hypothetical protein
MIVADYLQKIEEYHKARKLDFKPMEVPYSVGRDFYYGNLYSNWPELDDGHRFVRMFKMGEFNEIEQVGYLCVCGIFVDLIHNEKGYYCVGRCGVDSHRGAELLSHEGIEAPYLLKPNYREFVTDTEGYYTDKSVLINSDLERDRYVKSLLQWERERSIAHYQAEAKQELELMIAA